MNYKDVANLLEAWITCFECYVNLNASLPRLFFFSRKVKAWILIFQADLTVKSI